MDKSEYVSPNKIRKRFDVSLQVLRYWADNGKVSVVRLPSGKRLYKASDIENLFSAPPSKSKKKICYARVSSDHQKQDLQRQIDFLRKTYPGYEIISDIGSGLNWKRKGFNTLLESVYNGDVEEVVVAYKDRLCRFAFELVEWIFEKAGTKLVVFGETNAGESFGREDYTAELADDLLSITTVFVARHNGLRAAENRKNRRNQKDTVVPIQGSGDNPETVVRSD
jgi:predicted site-specific integrase-resolvase